MKFYSDTFKIEHFNINFATGLGWFISCCDDCNHEHMRCVYMHRDGTLHNNCGSENFFETEEEASLVLTKAFGQTPEAILPNKLFEI